MVFPLAHRGPPACRWFAITDPSKFGYIVVKVGSDGRITRLKDIGRVDLAGADYNTTSDCDSHPTAALAVFQLPGTNAIDTFSPSKRASVGSQTTFSELVIRRCRKDLRGTSINGRVSFARRCGTPR